MDHKHIGLRGIEGEVFSDWRRHIGLKPDRLRLIKRRFSKRIRLEEKAKLRKVATVED